MYNRLDTDRTVELTEWQEEKLQVAEEKKLGQKNM